MNYKCVYFNLSFYAVKVECEGSDIILFWSEEKIKVKYTIKMIKSTALTYVCIYFLKPTERNDVCYLFKCGTFQKLYVLWQCEQSGFTTDYK